MRLLNSKEEEDSTKATLIPLAFHLQVIILYYYSSHLACSRTYKMIKEIIAGLMLEPVMLESVMTLTVFSSFLVFLIFILRIKVLSIDYICETLSRGVKHLQLSNNLKVAFYYVRFKVYLFYNESIYNQILTNYWSLKKKILTNYYFVLCLLFIEFVSLI